MPRWGVRPRPSLYSRAPWAVWAWLGTASVALLLVLALPGWSDPWYVSYHAIAYLGAVILAIGAAFTRGTTAIVWWLLAGYQALNATGDFVYYREVETFGEVISPGWSDAIYLTASVVGVAALLILLWSRRTPADPVALIDTAIMVVALAAILGVFVVVPALDGSEVRAGALVVAFAYPLLDLAVLAGIVRILFGGGIPQHLLGAGGNLVRGLPRHRRHLLRSAGDRDRSGSAALGGCLVHRRGRDHGGGSAGARCGAHHAP